MVLHLDPVDLKVLAHFRVETEYSYDPATATATLLLNLHLPQRQPTR